MERSDNGLAHSIHPIIHPIQKHSFMDQPNQSVRMDQITAIR